LSHSSSPFCSGYFGDGVFQSICPGWSWNVIPTISASQLSRIIGMSNICNSCLARMWLLEMQSLWTKVARMMRSYWSIVSPKSYSWYHFNSWPCKDAEKHKAECHRATRVVTEWYRRE
jgi:hypothetical protein